METASQQQHSSSQKKHPTLAQRYCAENQGKWHPMPNWFSEIVLRSTTLPAFGRFFLVLWASTVCNRVRGELSILISTRDIANSGALNKNAVSRYMAAMQACGIVTFTARNEYCSNGKSRLEIHPSKLFDDLYMRDFVEALHHTICDEDFEVETAGTPRWKNAEFAAQVKVNLQKERMANKR